MPTIQSVVKFPQSFQWCLITFFILIYYPTKVCIWLLNLLFLFWSSEVVLKGDPPWPAASGSLGKWSELGMLKPLSGPTKREILGADPAICVVNKCSRWFSCMWEHASHLSCFSWHLGFCFCFSKSTSQCHCRISHIPEFLVAHS